MAHLCSHVLILPPILSFVSAIMLCIGVICVLVMAKNPSLVDFDTMPYMDLFKKLKRFRLFEPSLGILGFVFVTVCLVCSFFYLDYRSEAKGFWFPTETERFRWLKLGGNLNGRKVEFLSEMGDGCDVFEGDWDDLYPLYKSKDCMFLDEGFRCSENGRPDLLYTKWRWQPKGCNLPRF